MRRNVELNRLRDALIEKLKIDGGESVDEGSLTVTNGYGDLNVDDVRPEERDVGIRASGGLCDHKACSQRADDNCGYQFGSHAT